MGMSAELDQHAGDVMLRRVRRGKMGGEGGERGGGDEEEGAVKASSSLVSLFTGFFSFCHTCCVSVQRKHYPVSHTHIQTLTRPRTHTHMHTQIYTDSGFRPLCFGSY